MGITSTDEGAVLRCGVHQLEGRLSSGGLKLVSTQEVGKDEFRVLATSLGRSAMKLLPVTGSVTASDRLAQFVRADVIEEYSVSMEGIRQDFVIGRCPTGGGRVRVALTVEGALAEATKDGAKLVLAGSGREIAYSRLRVTDAHDRVCPARMEVISGTALHVVVDDTNAVYPLRIDPTFSDADWVGLNPDRLGVDGSIYAIAHDGAGNVYVGGKFTMAGTVAAKNVARWDGTRWWPLGTGVDASVSAMVCVGGEVYVGGSFTQAGGIGAARMARWDGEAWHPLGSGVNNFVRTLAYADGVIYVSGDFSMAGEASASRVARWDGVAWSAMGTGMDDAVYKLLPTATGVYAAGIFTTAGGVAAGRVAFWNGTTWGPVGSGFSSGHLNGLAWFQGRLHVCGQVPEPEGGSDMAGLLDWDGNQWRTLRPGIVVNLLSIPDRLVYFKVGEPGLFTICSFDGSVEAALRDVGGLGSPFCHEFIDNELWVGGAFSQVIEPGTSTSIPAGGLVRWNGTDWSALGQGINNTVRASVWHKGALYVGGTFTAQGGLTGYLARWSGTEWQPLGTGVNGPVYALATEGETLYAGGSFTTAGGQPAIRVAAWNGTAWSALGTGVNDLVSALTVREGKVYAGGGFTQAGGAAAARIAVWDGNTWARLGNGMNAQVRALAFHGSDLYAGGEFSQAGNVGASRVARWNGTEWSSLGNGTNSSVYCLAVVDGVLHAGGRFTTAGGNAAKGVARWNGSAWSALGQGMSSTVNAMVVSGGRIYAAGASPSSLCSWNGISWTDQGTRFRKRDGGTTTVFTLVEGGPGRLFVGGNFDLAGTTWSPFVAQANLPGSTFNALDAWRHLHFGTYNNEGQAADTADADHDGIANLAEYALGSSPVQNSFSSLPQPRVSDGDFVLSFEEPPGINGIVYGAEWSASLAPDSWQPVDDRGWPPLHIFSVPMGTHQKIFMRLKMAAQ